MLNHRHGEPSPRDAQTQGFTNKGHMEGGICRFMSTDTRTKQAQRETPRTGIQRFQDTLTVDHLKFRDMQNLGMQKDRNTQILEHTEAHECPDTVMHKH